MQVAFVNTPHGLRWTIGITFILILGLSIQYSATARSGQGAEPNSFGLDPTFGVGGKVTTGFLVDGLGPATGVALQPDGKVVAVGYSYLGSNAGYVDFTVMRFNADGSADTGFGSSGKTATDFSGGADQANSVVLQGDGKIVVGGSTSPSGSGQDDDFALARYSTNGSLDPTFGTGGRVITTFGSSNGDIMSLAIQPDGKIVAAGWVANAGENRDFALARYDFNGTLDSGFGTGGEVTINFGGGTNTDDMAFGVAVYPDGRIVAAGSALLPSGGTAHEQFALARLHGDGTLDSTFGTGGRVVGLVDTVAFAVAIDSSGKVVAGGEEPAYDTDSDFVLARFNLDGTPDTTFGGSGWVTTSFGNTGVEVVHGLALTQDGKIIAGGMGSGATGDFALAKYNGDGSLDGTFGTGGKVLTDFEAGGDGIQSIALDGTGGLVAGGICACSQAGEGPFALARYDANGNLVPSFHGNGKLATTPVSSLDDQLQAIALQADSKILVGGESISDSCSSGCPRSDFTVARYNFDGSIDTSFGNGGVVHTDLSPFNYDQLHDLQVQSDGKIVAAGSTYTDTTGPDFGLVRYNPNGSLDTTFGSGGVVFTDFSGGTDNLASIAIRPDGKIVAGGNTTDFTTFSLALARYNTDGTLDPTFGNGGKVVTTLPGEGAQLIAVTTAPGNKILAAGDVVSTTTSLDFAVVRYNPDGSLDTSFGTGGYVVTDFASHEDTARSVVQLADGKILVGGETGTYPTYDFALARYNTDGTLDPTFGNGGKVVTDFNSTTDQIYSVLIDLQGKIVATGTSSGDFALARYNTDGTLDPTFGNGGLITTNILGYDTAQDAALTQDGRVTLAGYAIDPGTTRADFALARYAENTATPTPTVAPSSPTIPAATTTPTRTSTPVVPTSSTPTERATSTAAGTSTSTPIQMVTSTATGTGTSTPTPMVTSTSCTVQFTDVAPGSTFYPYVHCLACLGLINGYQDGTFKPSNQVTRGQLSKIVANSAGFNDPQPNQTFQDVPLGSTFQVFVGRLASRGYINGYPCGGPGEPCVSPANLPYFRPNNNATRGQISKIVSNAAEFNDPPNGQQFEDVPISSTYYTYTYRLVVRSVMAGYQCGGPGEPCVPPANLPYFRPNNNATRGQTSKIVGNTFFPNCQTP